MTALRPADIPSFLPLAPMSSEDYIPVICIGGGIAGICLGIQLQRQLGLTDFRIYEQLHEFGGTWCVQTYPGIFPSPKLSSMLLTRAQSA